MPNIFSRLGRLADAFAVLSGWGIIVFAAAVSLEVILRKVAGISLQGLDEYGGYLLAVTSSFGFGYALVQRAHIRVDVFVRLVSEKSRSILHILAITSLTFFACMIFYSAIMLFISSWKLSARAVSPLQTPLIFPQGVWVIGLGLFALTSVVASLLSLSRAMRGDWAGVNAIAGAASAEEEVQEELKAAHERGVAAEERVV